MKITELQGNGDFRSAECIEYLKQADVVVTNPPFSLFREYVAQLMEYGKKFIVIGNMNAIGWKEIFSFIKNNELWLGFNNVSIFRTNKTRIEDEKKQFIENNAVYQKFGNICWFTNLIHNKRLEGIETYKEYSAENYPKYDNYDAIEVSRTCDIPCDYNGVMGVPISFLEKYNPKQFEIVGIAQGSEEVAGDYYLGIISTIKYDGGKARAYINGKAVYSRILIKKVSA